MVAIIKSVARRSSRAKNKPTVISP